MKIIVTQPYAGIKPGNEYSLVKEAVDHKVIKVKGSVVSVPNWAFEGKLHRKYQKEEPEEYQDFILGE